MDPAAAVDMTNLLDGYFCLFTKQKSLLPHPSVSGTGDDADGEVPTVDV